MSSNISVNLLFPKQIALLKKHCYHRDPRRRRAWALLFLYTFGGMMHCICFQWVEHRTRCSNGQLGASWPPDLLRADFLPLGLFEIFFFFVDRCLLIFCTVVQSLRFVNLRLSSTTRSSSCIFLYVFNLWRMKSTAKSQAYLSTLCTPWTKA